MTNSYSAGEDIESWCTKCKLELGHTIVAMVGNLPKRVKCNTCNSEHNYRGEPARKSNTVPGQKKKPRGKTYKDSLALLAEADHSSAKAYSIKSTFRENDLIDHPKFGTGLVQSTVKSNKIEVFFKDGPRLLIHNM